jgi:hypothetical protein
MMACASLVLTVAGCAGAQTADVPANGANDTVPQTTDQAAPAPDKSGYTLFDPVPDSELRPFETDRPTKSNTPYTVDAGHFQYEADLVNSTYDHYSYGHATTSDTVVADPTLKLGLTDHSDLEVALAPFNFVRSSDRTTGLKTDGNGFGDVYTRLKVNLLGDDGGDYALAVVPYFKAPTASHTVGNGHYEGGAYAPFSFALPGDVTGTVMTEVDVLENADLTGTHENYQNLINFGHAIGAAEDNLTGYVEFYSDVDNDTGLQPYYTADFALAWLVSPNFQLDIGTNVGLNKAAPDLQGYIGISQRF